MKKAKPPGAPHGGGGAENPESEGPAYGGGFSRAKA